MTRCAWMITRVIITSPQMLTLAKLPSKLRSERHYYPDKSQDCFSARLPLKGVFQKLRQLASVQGLSHQSQSIQQTVDVRSGRIQMSRHTKKPSTVP